MAEQQDEEEDDLDLTAALAIANAPEEAAEDEDFDEAAFFGDIDDEDEDEGYDDETAAQPAPVEPARPVARVLKVKRRDFEAAVAEGAIEEDEDDLPEAIQRGESSLSPEDEAELQSELQALEQEIARGAAEPVQVDEIEEADEDEDHDDLAFADMAEEYDEDDMSWDMDDEDDEDEDDIAFGEDDDEDEDDDDLAFGEEDDADEEEADDAPEAPINPRRRLLRGADDDMDRILAETNNQLGDSDGTRRRSAIAHLRAAVAATKAEKQAGAVTESDEQEVADAYRDDLAQVVRPRRPVVRGDSLARRADDRPAPLKLVAEQRVDLPGINAGPVRPRRVRMADLALSEKAAEREVDTDAEAHARAAATNAASFNEFAERVGAAGLPDLLEAAASYLSFVEGRDQFTRPQLMVKARQALEDEFSREDGLRHFGRLLREGKLRKVAAGHFTVSDRISFRPEERAAG